MSGILLSLIPLVGWGVSDYLASKLSKLHPALVNMLYMTIGLLNAAVLIIVFELPEFTTKSVLLHLCASVLLTAAFVTFIRAFSVGAVGIVSPIANAYALVTAFASVVFLGVFLTPLGWVAAAVVLVGIAMLSYKNNVSATQEAFKQSIKLSVFAMVLFGLGFFMLDIASEQRWYQDYALFQIVNASVATLLFVLWVRKDRVKQLKKALRMPTVYAGALVAGIGTIGLFSAIESIGSATIPVLVSAASTLVTSFLAFYFDKEHLDTKQRAGAVVVVAGIMLLSL